MSVIKQQDVYTDNIDYFWCGKCGVEVRFV
jgi:hypothetical protein